MSLEKIDNVINICISPTKPPVEEKVKVRKTFWNINKEMLRFKIHFFLYLGGIAAGIPYVIVLAKTRIGISASSLGVVLTVQMFLFIFTKPMIGYLADYYNKLKEIISVLIVIYMTCYFTMLAIPSIPFETYPNSSEFTLKNAFNAIDISRQCTKYNEVTLTFLLENKTSISRVVFPGFNHRNATIVSETTICHLLSENNFESLFLNSLKFSKHSEETSKDRSLKFPVTLYKNGSCFIGLMSEISNFLQNEMLEDIELSEISSCHLLEDDTQSPSPIIELECISCDFLKQAKKETPSFRKKDYQTYQFWIFSLLDTISAICVSGIFTLSDTACFESIQKHSGDFGRQRLWGNIGWGFVAPLAGLLNDYTDDFLAAYILMGILLSLFLWNITKIDLVKPHYSKNILKDVGTVLRSRDFLFFEVVIFCNGIGTGIIWYYLIWFLNSIGGSELLIGLSLTVQSFVGVIPFMFFSGWFIRKFGHFNLLVLSMAAYGIRFLWYSYLQNPWWILPVEFLHGINYGLYYAVLGSYAKLSAKPGTEATTQAIVFSTHEGLGAGIGCVLCGMGFDYFGGRQTFFYASLFCMCSVFIGIVLSAYLQTRKGEAKFTSPKEKF